MQPLPRHTHTHPQHPLLEPPEISLLPEGQRQLKPALTALLTWQRSGSCEVNPHHDPAVMNERNRRCIPPRLFQHPSLGFCAWRGFQACQGTVPSHVLQCCTTDNSGPEDSHRAISSQHPSKPGSSVSDSPAQAPQPPTQHASSQVTWSTTC